MISKAGKKNNGFTLIELLIVLVIVGLMMGLVINQAGKMFERQMKNTTNRLASTIRYLYNKAVSDGLTLRLVLDMDESKYWVERTSQEGFALEKEGEERTENRERKAESRKQKAENREQKTETETEMVETKEAAFSPEASYLIKPVTLPKGVYFKDVFAEHQSDRLESGQGTIYFFPQGYVERSIINFRDREDKVHYSLEVNPISGRVKIERKYKEMEGEK